MADTIESLKTDLLASQERARLLLGSNESLMSALTIATQAEVEARKELAASQIECERLRAVITAIHDHRHFSEGRTVGGSFIQIIEAAEKALSTPQSTDALAAHDTKGIDNGQG